ncbi:MAG TPA: DUF4149 domain-containing protein [Anaerolinea thermolimosa]|uniref:DUF4149 domain-containing protein n=1 Tax=Anaerolinea thermolimosa TaxID=229919 RepID=A0A3D1JG93_9CHLR|nr:DUF4149 domain-containing protein [Anaerolinea thermolimosa]GAP07279.1 predicted integral membrane protein [Anaerolinea thermolimosa]HCE17245.1 DUF4149 domain-containing protein [Anaerolinea thermolimosa]
MAVGSPFLLTLLYWLHMLATVAWLGSLSGLALIFLPAARKSLDLPTYALLLGRIQPRIQQIGWLSLVILGATGMFQMSANPNYHGFLSIDTPWAKAILTKHLAVLVMVALSAWNTWWVLPALHRLTLLRQAGKTPASGEQSRLERQEALLLNLNLALSVIVLALTAWARSS